MTAALWYARNGIPVFPCKAREKAPLTPHGFQDATTNEDPVRRWWTQWPNANIGIPTGRLTGLLAIDIDPRNGGDGALRELELQHGAFPNTAAQLTGGGGRHLFFRYRGGPVPKLLAKGIDLKADGGYVIVPPSVHASGKSYQWSDSRETLLDPAEIPGWLDERLRLRSSGKVVRRETVEPSPKWSPGERNQRLAALAGAMRRQGSSLETIDAALLAENLRNCDPPLSDVEVRGIAISIASYPPKDERSRASSGANLDLDLPRAAWPEALSQAAYHGVTGDLVRAIEPHSEADPAGLLIQFLVAFGNVIGRSAHFVAEADRHYMNLFVVLVGQTSKGRKGTSLGHVLRVLAGVDTAWSESRITSGLATGEGLIWSVRDEAEDLVSGKEHRDNRLMVTEPEFARVLQVAEREANTLSAIIRQAWDSGNLRVLTKKDGARSTDAHISIIGHVTKDELRRHLTDTAAGNGFANRFLWVCTRRSKFLPEGGALHTVDFAPINRQIAQARNFARVAMELQRDTQARELWRAVYPRLSEGRPGLLGAVTSRSEAQTMRLACVYALLDCSGAVRSEHLLAALEIWRYCEASARFIFGDALGDAVADEILRELRQNPLGLSRNDIREHFQRNKTSAEIGRALNVLQEHGLADVSWDRETDGQKRPTERWVATRGYAVNAVDAIDPQSAATNA